MQALIDYIEGGHSLNAFLDDFPTVTREVAVAGLEQAKAPMRVLLDECVPRSLRQELPGHEVKTVAETGWAGVKNVGRNPFIAPPITGWTFPASGSITTKKFPATSRANGAIKRLRPTRWNPLNAKSSGT